MERWSCGTEGVGIPLRISVEQDRNGTCVHVLSSLFTRALRFGLVNPHAHTYSLFQLSSARSQIPSSAIGILVLLPHTQTHIQIPPPWLYCSFFQFFLCQFVFCPSDGSFFPTTCLNFLIIFRMNSKLHMFPLIFSVVVMSIFFS